MITERDTNILRQLARMRFLSTYQIATLLDFEGTNWKEDVVRRRTRKLEEEGLLKSFRPDVYTPKIFYLSEKGVEYVSGHFGLDDLKMQKRTSLVPHILKIADFYCAIYELEKEGFSIEQFITDWTVKVLGTDLKPDLYFSLLHKKRHLGFVEIDMGTYSIKTIIEKKLPKYEELFKTDPNTPSGFTKKYGSFPMVYFLTTSQERADNIRNRLAKHKTTDIVFKVATFESLDNILKLLEG